MVSPDLFFMIFVFPGLDPSQDSVMAEVIVKYMKARQVERSTIAGSGAGAAAGDGWGRGSLARLI